MASVKLTSSIRECILENMYKKLYEDRIKEADNEMYDLAEAFRIDVLGKHFAAFEALPDFMVNHNDTFHVTINDASVRFALSGRCKLWNKTWHEPKEYDANHPLVLRYHELSEKRKSLEDEWQEVRQAAYGMIHGVTTLKRLREEWPEVEEYLPEFADETKQLPAVVAESLNCLIANAKGANNDCGAVARA